MTRARLRQNLQEIRPMLGSSHHAEVDAALLPWLSM